MSDLKISVNYRVQFGNGVRNAIYIFLLFTFLPKTTGFYESSRLDIETKFELSHSAFIRVVMKFGNPEIDLFASRINAKCQNYVS